MASNHTDHASDDDGTPPRTEISDHKVTYDAFLNLTKWATGVVVLVLVGMAVFLL